MTPRILRLAPVAMAALLLAAPADAQSSGPTVTYGDIGVTLSPALGLTVAIMPVTGQPPDSQIPGGPHPDSLTFSFSDVSRAQVKIPGPFGTKGVLTVYETADLAEYGWASEQLSQLQTLLATRPDVATLGGGPDPDALPYVGGGEAAQIVHAHAQYIDTPELSGIAYLAAFGQDVYRMGRDDFWYVFQGLSADGSRYVELTWMLRVPGFPKSSSYKPSDSNEANYQRYLEGVVAKLDGVDPGAVSPSLEELDALVRSITLGGAPTISPGPGTPGAPVASPAG